MKRLYLLLIVLCASSMISIAQDFSYDANPKKFDLAIGGQLFSGDGGLMDFYATEFGYRFHPNWSVRAGFSVGVGNDWKTHRSDIADLGISRIIRNKGLTNFETLVTLGGGYLWDRYSDSVNGKALGMGCIESRLYVSSRSFVGFKIKEYVGKDYIQTSFLGISIGVRF
ncbi:MAG: hypothetical protein ACI399_06170 [Candidatus Cryptobacteroides sp.]